MKTAVLAAALFATAAAPAFADDNGAPRGPAAAVAVAANLPGYQDFETDPAAHILYLEFSGVATGTRDARLIAERICDESRDAGWVGSWIVATTDGGKPTAACLAGTKHADLRAKVDAVGSVAVRAGAEEVAIDVTRRTIRLGFPDMGQASQKAAAMMLAPLCALAMDLDLGAPWTVALAADTEGATPRASCAVKAAAM